MIKQWITSLPLRKKIIYPIWSLLTLGIFIVGASVSHFMGVSHAQNLHARASILAQGVTSNLSAALIFNDKQTGIDQMNALQFDPEVIAAKVITPKDESFAKIENLPKDCRWENQAITCQNTEHFMVSNPIDLNGDHLGTLHVWVSKERIIQQRNHIILIFVITALALSVLALLFAYSLHSLIAKPLQSIYHSIQNVIYIGVTNQRLPTYQHNDEIGRVSICFNDMLDKLSYRDLQLARTLQQIESKNHYVNQVLNSLDQGLIVISRKMTIEAQNATFIDFFGELDTIQQLDIKQKDLFTPDILRHLIKHHTYELDTKVWTKKGHWLPCLISIKVIKNPKNKAESFVLSFKDQTEKLEIERLNHETNHDLLTGLANRQNAKAQLLEAHNNQQSAYILFLDLDGFKAVNDTYGHQCGDELLQVIAQRLEANVPQHDLVARLSGDEFLLALFNHDNNANLESHYHQTINQLLHEINKPINVNDVTPTVSASIGAYYWASSSNEALEEVLKKADKAMYQAKLAGKNQYYIAK